MTEIHAMTEEHPYWEPTIRFAEQCSWRAGPHLAREMRKSSFKDWERVFCAVVDGKVAGFCTLAKKDELPPSYGLSPFIGFVFVGEAFRGNRLSQRMINAATAYAGEIGFPKVYLMSGEIGLYEKYGFRKLGDYPTIYDTVDQLFCRETGKSV